MPPQAKLEDGTLAVRQLAPSSPSARRGGCGLTLVGSSKSCDRSHIVPGRACLSVVPGDCQGIISSAPYGTGYHAPLRPSCSKNQETIASRPASLTMRSQQHCDLDRKGAVVHSPQASGHGVSRPSIMFQQGLCTLGFSNVEPATMGSGMIGPKVTSNVSASKTAGHSNLPGSPPSRKPGTGVYMPGSALPSGPNRTSASNGSSSKGHASGARASANLSPPSPRQPHHHHGNHNHHHSSIHHNPQHGGNGQQMHHSLEYRGIVNTPGGARQVVTAGPLVKGVTSQGVLPVRGVQQHSSPPSHFEVPSDAARGTLSPRSPQQVMAASPRHLAVSPRSLANQLHSPPPRTPPSFLPVNGPNQEWTLEAITAAARRGNMGRWQPGTGANIKGGWCNNMGNNSAAGSEPFSGSSGHCSRHGAPPPWSPTNKLRNVQPQQQRQAPTSPHGLRMDYSTDEVMTPSSQVNSRCVGSTRWQQQCFSHYGADAKLREVLDFQIKIQQQVQLAALAGASEPQSIPVSTYNKKALPPRPGQPTSPKSPLDEVLEAEEEWRRQQIHSVSSLRSPAELKESEVVSGVFLPSEDELGAGWS